MPTEKSAGTVLYRIEDGKIKYLLLYKKKHLQYNESWDFPKGNVEEKSEIDTVKREVKEETGIVDLTFIPSFKETLTFFYMKDSERVFKIVSVFLCKTNEPNVVLSKEHNGFRWCIYEEALRLASYKDSKEVIRKANNFLQRRPKIETFTGGNRV